MTCRVVSLLLVMSMFMVGLTPAQQFAPPAAKTPAEATLKTIAAKTEKLGAAIAALKRQNVRDPGLAEVEIFHKAALWIVQHGEWFHANSGDWTVTVLDRGLLRASQLAAGEAPWMTQTGQQVVRAYRSRVDGSVQPYAITLPASYGKERKQYRLDVVLHGRDASLCEVKFLYQYGDGKAAPKDLDAIRLDIYGRGNNAYRWAGETDVFEAIDHFFTVERALGRERLLDPRRVVLRGFSMGGAGAWHLGLHHPDKWCVVGPGAGFSVTHGYIKGLPKLPDYQESCLCIYDAADYAENAANVPVVAYSGGDDAQKAAADNIEARLKGSGIGMTHLIAPGVGHSVPAEFQKKLEVEYARFAVKGRDDYPARVRFVTYTLRYPSCAWIELLGLDKHYDKALVEGEKTDKGYTLKTANIRSLRLTLPDPGASAQAVTIDGQALNVQPQANAAGVPSVYLERVGGQWRGVLPQKLQVAQQRQPRKVSGQQGPIDDAFRDPFLCVRGTGKPWNEAAQKHADASLQRFAAEWHKFMRGELLIKNDVDVTEDDINGRHLVLFGDPSSNSLIAQVLDGLPLKWTKDSITLAGKTYTAADHVPALIYPSPLHTGRYVVLNSGHTFHAPDFQGTNALLYPRLGDWAILKPTPTEKAPAAADVAAAGLFDDAWQAK